MKRNNKGQFKKTRFDRLCLDCKKPLAGYKSKRCSVCAVQERLKHHSMPIHNTKHSKESKVKMSIARKGKGLWLGETRNLPTGEKHHRWLGGKSCLAEKLRKGLRYKNWRKVVFERDDFTCHNCNKRGGRIEGHHIIEFVLLLDKYKINSQDEAYKCKQLWDISNGQTLCYKCHNLTKKGYGTRK